MGVLISDVVRVLHPEHKDHCITVKFKGGDGEVPDRIWWDCECGISGVIPKDAVGDALRRGLVTAT